MATEDYSREVFTADGHSYSPVDRYHPLDPESSELAEKWKQMLEAVSEEVSSFGDNSDVFGFVVTVDDTGDLELTDHYVICTEAYIPEGRDSEVVDGIPLTEKEAKRIDTYLENNYDDVASELENVPTGSIF